MDDICRLITAAARLGQLESSLRIWPDFSKRKNFKKHCILFLGCGSGKYLNINPSVFNIGSDRCRALAQLAREKDQEVLHCDNLALPFRDESLDAVLSVAVIHHIATVERRVRALRELARVLRVGGRVMISVWAMEQSHRRVGRKKNLLKIPSFQGASCLAIVVCVSSLSSNITVRQRRVSRFYISRQCRTRGQQSGGSSTSFYIF